MAVSLRIVRGKHEGQVFNLKGETLAVIGRAPEATITLDDALLSRKHCRIELTREAVRLVDLQSTNGTFLNKQRVECESMGPWDFFQAGGNLFQILPLPKTPAPLGDGFVCPECREDVPLPTPETTGEVPCPHCEHSSTPGKDVIGQYRLNEVIGRGSSGLVYRATDLRDDRVVALKTVRLEGEIDAKTLSRYLRVSYTEGTLFHPNIVQVYRTSRASGFFTIAMEYVDGVTLYQRICEEEKLGVADALEIATQVASALVHASEKGVVHRDVKPENILVTRGAVAKLMDFSIAKRYRSSAEAPVTLTGEGLGTLYYVPPEQIYDAANVDRRADIYALGCTLYHMLTGSPPFKEAMDKAKKQGVLIRILSAECQPLDHYTDGVPEEVVRITSKAMAREVKERYQGPAELLEELQAAAEELRGG